MAARAAMLALTLAAGAAAFAQAPASDEEIIVQVRSNGVDRGDFALLRRADGDIWIPEADLARLQIQPRGEARRQRNGETFYSSAALGAAKVLFDEAQLTLEVDFRADALQGTRIDLSERRQPRATDGARTSMVLSYRLSMMQSGGAPLEGALEADANVRWQGILLRQEARLLTSAQGRHFQRGATQAIHDDRTNARRYVAGDVLSTAGPYGSGITGAGLLLQKVYDLTPDVVRQPTPTLQASTSLPAEVEVTVDGTTAAALLPLRLRSASVRRHALRRHRDENRRRPSVVAVRDRAGQRDEGAGEPADLQHP